MSKCVSCNQFYAHLRGNYQKRLSANCHRCANFGKIDLAFNYHENWTWIKCASAMPVITFNRTIIISYVRISCLKDLHRDWDAIRLDFSIKNHLSSHQFFGNGVACNTRMQRRFVLRNKNARKNMKWRESLTMQGNRIFAIERFRCNQTISDVHVHKLPSSSHQSDGYWHFYGACDLF